MLYAQIVVGLPVEGPFDYIIPPEIERKAKIGSRALVEFGHKKTVGYIVGISAKSEIKNLKSLLEVIDERPVLGKGMLSLAKSLSGYYCCSWGQMIETSLPQALRQGRSFGSLAAKKVISGKGRVFQASLIHDLSGRQSQGIYLKEVKAVLAEGRSVIAIFPDISAALKARDFFAAESGARVCLFYRSQAKELDTWLDIRSGKIDIVVGTRSAVFAPLNNLGLMIIDEEENFVYKQDQSPHYHCRQAAFARGKIEKAKVILTSSSPSLESYYLAQKKKIAYSFIPAEALPEVKVFDSKYMPEFLRYKKAALSKYLQDDIQRVLEEKGKVLVFLNRKGFATFLSCQSCAKPLNCPRCNLHLVYYFKEQLLRCHRCSFKMELPKICPDCNAGYIKYFGIGTEKIESELARIFPAARIKIVESAKGQDFEGADIFIATESVLKEGNFRFDLSGVLSIDNSLNRIDLRSSEKVFALLVGLLKLTKERMIIQTGLPEHYCFKALENRDISIFYNQELSQRRQLKFPPYKHLALVKLRGMNQDKVEQASRDLFGRLRDAGQDKVKVLSLSCGQPPKLRGNFYWQILLSSSTAFDISRFLKIHLKTFKHSGIIVTVDVDPI